jgi:hypothetical protein
MSDTSEAINKQTGINLQVLDSVVLRSGLKAERAYILIGEVRLALMLIKFDESFNFSLEIKNLLSLAEYERVVIYSSRLLKTQMNELKEKKIGYIDDLGHFYIPLDLQSSDPTPSTLIKESRRSPSALNEFPIGYLFFKNFGLIDSTQAEIAELIGKSTATVNLVFKRMEKEKHIVKIEKGYHITNLENYFDRWRFILSQYKNSKEFPRFTSKLNDQELRQLQSEKISDEHWALSGPKAESLLEDGYLESASECSIFFEAKSEKRMMKYLKLIPNLKGEITTFPTILDVRNKGQFANDIVISAELINSNNPRLKEAGKRRFEKYIREANEVINERFGKRHF